jgi:electron-transferring-flavoprotein dehydrogenase
MLAGCSAGFLNVAKIKGTHNAMKTGMLAAETIFNSFDGQIAGKELKQYETDVRSSWVVEELKSSRNFKGGFEKGLYKGLIHGGIVTHLTKGKEPWTFAHKKRDS